MSIDVEKTALMEFLKAKEVKFFSKAKELREEVEKWLSYTPQTFPHYTRHTVQHSDEIILQASKFLFKEEDHSKPVVSLTPVEAYILVAAAYLHDSGMVSSDREKIEILQSEDWKRWTSGDGGGAKRWQEVQKLRQGDEPADEKIRNFLADLQTRFLVAEFIRRAHHLRAADVVQQHQALLGRFAFDDGRLQRTIADVCVAHGLRQNELEDNERYPERRDIMGQAVNVRFLAIALRLGDLLDMSYDRACPLLLNAACPLPADSLAHWTQYQRIIHFLTATDLIEITAECNTQEEHRVLQDWCQWIAEEVKNAKVLMARATRHKDWALPNVVLEGDHQTIKIRKSAKANYIPSKWMLELDQEAIFKRLIYDVYDSPNVFIRELIQNALDANRCQMYADLQKTGQPTPESPTQVPDPFRERYPVKISLVESEKPNALSGEVEKRQTLVIEDCGIGMDNDVIERYFLQVGRSFYTTDEFRRSFQFVPTSRFGIGFLSVFAVSDQVTVETYKPSSPQQSGPIRLTLIGPRSYLLTEKGQRTSSGTCIEVLLQEPLDKGTLTSLVADWCKRVEFPILVNDLGWEKTIVAEKPDEFTYEIPEVTEEGATFAVRAFPVNRPGIEGELYVFEHVNSKGVSWADLRWARSVYPNKTPQASEPVYPGNLICFHGIQIKENRSSRYDNETMTARIDYRSSAYQPGVSRESVRSRSTETTETDPRVESRWEEILSEHLATAPHAAEDEGWKYKQQLVEVFPLTLFWETLPGTIRVYQEGVPQLVSLELILTVPVITTISTPATVSAAARKRRHNSGKCSFVYICKDISMMEEDIDELSGPHLNRIFESRSVQNIRWIENQYLAIDWHLSSAKTELIDNYGWYRDFAVLPGKPDVIGHRTHRVSPYGGVRSIFNLNNPYVCWLRSLAECTAQGNYNLQQEQFDRLMHLTHQSVTTEGRYRLAEFKAYYEGWRALLNLPPELQPPEIEFTEKMFQLTPPEDEENVAGQVSKPAKRRPSKPQTKRTKK